MKILNIIVLTVIGVAVSAVATPICARAAVCNDEGKCCDPCANPGCLAGLGDRSI
ncbi:hypothetical protein CALCODRAFT_489541 [Calocera cornea HHB12733]|uniref:Transmembrane protein n=1 Tax=Calocera cornea HHB12733 TaxID=1353952 RepID=A0A165KDF6_9BASI|nr:hypothetical protein CALCODRAFT_489541 [Calocera cornea HHB12733]